VTVTLPTVPQGATVNAFHGDVSQGCVRIQGNQAIVVGKLPPNEQYDVQTGSGARRITWASAVVEDNGVATGAPVDRASPVLLFETSGTAFCTTASFADLASHLVALDSGDLRFDYTDLLDANPANGDSVVSVVNPGGLSVSLTDAPDPLGVRATVGAGTGAATFNVCGGRVDVAAGSTVDLTCASVIVNVLVGAAEVVLGDGLAVVSVPEGGAAEVSDDGTGGFTVQNLGTVEIGVTVDGVEAVIAPGATSAVEAWSFLGFSRPVASSGALNKVTAGSDVPLKWQLLDASGAPVTDLSSAAITVSQVDCGSKADLGGLEPGRVVGHGLENRGGGYYELGWRTPKGYAGTCRAVHLDIGDGVSHDALFTFPRR
jgi:hypothetical protein